ncbi:MAG: hypothetical protein KatS3mg105_3058 [Gemmatales bacterium]|nr:MAG: hypothetical protein KatS3mg105_3058 [Gemmatales bacterium]
MLAHPVTRWLNEKLLGITGRRRLPLFAEQSLFQLVRKNHHESQAGKPARVVFFVDTFANYFDVETGLAVLETLRALDDFILFAWAGETGSDDGCHSFGLQCCGRPLISNGLLDEAVECARNNVKRLYPYAAEGIPIVAAEPSCLLTMKDDYPALLRGDLRRRAERVAHLCQTFEEYVERRFAELPMSFRPWPRRIVVHGHCHQRSLVGMEPTLQLLRRMPNADVRDSNAGCCGMAGSFGYEAEHYELSRDVGEQRLFPLLRKESSEATVAAAGFSCRVQISHFTGVAAVHPAQIVAEALIRSSAGW